jgi:hypothetical protein
MVPVLPGWSAIDSLLQFGKEVLKLEPTRSLELLKAGNYFFLVDLL